MSYGNRSKEYDWFKGGKGKDNKSPKDTFKTIWKFTRIFLMFSLFFFSMWGCVQVFIIKTESQVGNGVEFYNSEDEIAPYVRQITVTQDAKGVYNIEGNTQNVWINNEENGEELKEVQAILKSEGTTKDAHKLSDAFKGKNEYFRIIKDDKPQKTSGKYLAMSSEQKAYSGAPAGATPAKVVLYKTNDKTQEITKVEYTYVNTDATFTNNVAKARHEYAKAILAAIDAQISGTSKFEDATLVKAAGHATPDDIRAAKIHNHVVVTALNASGAVLDETKKEFKVNSIGGFSDTHYRPIITWGDAFVRGVGPFYGLFVWPISKLGVAITNGMGMHNGWESLISIMVIVFILRLLAFAITFKSTLQQTKQQELQAKKAVIDSKYENYKGNKQMEARKRQEVSELYKKEGVSPLGPLGTIFITMPIFLSIWRVIGGIPHLKSTVWLGINFSSTSYKELFAGEWQYLPLILVAAASAALSQIFPRLLTKKRDKNRINVHQRKTMKKNNKTQNIVLIVYVIMAVIFSAGIQIYWIVGGIWQVIQTTITHHVIIHQKKRARNKVKA